ncbi:MAG: TolC family protein [Bacteroidales bacterium]
MSAAIKKYQVLTILLLLIVCSSKGTNPVIVKKITFDQAVDIAWQNSHVLKQVNYLQLQKDQERRAARGLYFPTIGIMANATLLSDPIHLDLNPVKDAITPLYQTLGNYGRFGDIPGISDEMATQLIRQKMIAGLAQVEGQEWDQVIQKRAFGVVAATVQWPLYAGGKIRAANRVSAINQKDVGDVTLQKQGELMSELVERYYGLCLARQVVTVRQEVFSGLQKHLEDALKLEKEGMISNADVMHAKVYHAQSSRELSKARQQVDVVAQALNGTMALGDTVAIEILSNLFYLDSIEPQSYFVTFALTKNPLLHQIESKKQLTIEAFKANRADFLPAVAVQGTYDIVNKDLSSYVPDWEIGIGLKWTLFDGVARFAKVKAASIRTQEIEEYGLKAESDINSMVNKLYHELTMYKDQLTELASARLFAEEYLRARETEFHQEMTNSTQVIDARLALAQVKTERLQAMYNYDVTLVRLLEYAGVPTDFYAYSTRPNAKSEKYQ